VAKGETTWTVTLDNGETAKRKSPRAYTHAIIAETTPAEKAAYIADAERAVEKAKAVLAERTGPGSTAKAKAEYEAILALDAYWHAQVQDGDRTIDRWLTLSKYSHDLKDQAGIDAHYARVREHLAFIPEGLDSDGRNIRALVTGPTPTVLGLKAEDSDYRGNWRQRRTFVDGLAISGLVSRQKYDHPVHKLADAREELARAERLLQAARDLTTGPESQGVLGWSQSKRNADNRVATEKARRPLARIFTRESVAKPVASRAKRG
jgi:hypothetical protein